MCEERNLISDYGKCDFPTLKKSGISSFTPELVNNSDVASSCMTILSVQLILPFPTAFTFHLEWG